jgi:hypothetical protein
MAQSAIFSIFFAMCLDLSNLNESDVQIISFTTDPIPMPDATKKRILKERTLQKLHGDLRTLWR